MKAMALIRSVIFAIGQMTTLVIFSVLGQLTRPFSMKVRYGFMHYWAVINVHWLRWTCGVKYRVHGAENIDRTKSGLILARHESAWETLYFQVLFPRQAYVLKEELLKIPFFGWGMALLNPIAIDRNAGRKALKQILTEGTERLHSGDWVVLFPEGTRMSPNELGKINIGGTMLAQKAEVPVYLVSHNAGSFWGKNSFIKMPGVIDVYVSPPLMPEEIKALTTEEMNQKIADFYRQSFN